MLQRLAHIQKAVRAHTGFSFKSKLCLTHQTRNVVCGCVLNMLKVSIKVGVTIPTQHLAAAEAGLIVSHLQRIQARLSGQLNL